MPKQTFDLNISAEEFIRYYQGQVKHIIVTTHSGQTMQLPALLFRRFVKNTGIQGTFVIEYDDQGKCKELKRG